MTLAILCSGQGNQHPDMFALTADAPEAAIVFAAATRALDGRDPRIIARSDDAIHANRVGQILCCTQALAAFAVLGKALGPRLVVAGYSVGELASWGCAGLFSPETVIDLALRRATLMDQVSEPGDGLAFVRGLGRAVIEELCGRHGAAIAIINPGELFVVGGAASALRVLCAEAIDRGATRTGSLKVAVASHTSNLAAASAGFRAALADAPCAANLPGGMRLIAGLDATPVLSIKKGLDGLADQISHPIDWAACLNACIEAGVDAMLELGPGKALTTMASAAYPAINARALEDFRSLKGVEAWLAAGR